MLSNRIIELFKTKGNNILSVYFTAGFPSIDDTVKIIKKLEKERVDLIEIGMPFSDPLADGPTIQESSSIALKNGMTIPKLFEQLAEIRKEVKIPLVLMGYINPVLQYGVEAFCAKAKEVGIDGCIIPDLPINEFVRDYKAIFDANNLSNILLITPQTSEERIRFIDENSDGFIYMVSTASTTGKQGQFSDETVAYFKRVQAMKLKNPTVIGFGIHDNQSFTAATSNANGAIIGSAFIKSVRNSNTLDADISTFVKHIKG
jgi:tryptophan synthase alpha chain